MTGPLVSRAVISRSRSCWWLMYFKGEYCDWYYVTQLVSGFSDEMSSRSQLSGK